MTDPNLQQIPRHTEGPEGAEEANEILLNLDKARTLPLAQRAKALAQAAFALEKHMVDTMPPKMRHKLGKINLYGALYGAEGTDIHQARADKENISKQEAKARNFFELYGGLPK